MGADDMDLVDVYSCFPSAVQIAARELGLPIGDADRPLTVTGGLTFAGGPWNNYVSHSIATMADKLAAAPDQVGLITANGGYLTKHSFGVYSATPPRHEFRWEDVQSAVDNRTHLRRRGRLVGRGHRRIVDDAVHPATAKPRRRFWPSARPRAPGLWP